MPPMNVEATDPFPFTHFPSLLLTRLSPFLFLFLSFLPKGKRHDIININHHHLHGIYVKDGSRYQLALQQHRAR